jgi:hypothetical protein
MNEKQRRKKRGNALLAAYRDRHSVHGKYRWQSNPALSLPLLCVAHDWQQRGAYMKWVQEWHLYIRGQMRE